MRMPPGHLLGKVSWARPTGRRPGANPGHTGVIISLDWAENTLVFPQISCRRELGRGRSRLLFLGC